MDALRIGLVLYGVITLTVCDCPNGWLQYSANCYHFSHDLEDWTGAMAMCKLMNGTLVEITSAAEDSFITSEVVQLSHFEPFIALSDVIEEGRWRWMVSGTDLDVTHYSNWAPGEPNNKAHNENCVTIKDPGYWSDDQCFNHHQFICERSADRSAWVVG